MFSPVKNSLITPVQGLVAYVLVGALWVFAGDAWLAHWVADPARLSLLQSWKGWLYVVLTGALAWWLLQRMRQAEQLHHGLTKELGRLAQFTSSGIALVDAQARIQWADARLCAWLHAPLEQLQAQAGSQTFSDWVQTEDRDWAAQQLARLLAGDIEFYQSRRECQPSAGHEPVPVLCTVTRAPRLAGQAQLLVCVLTPLGEVEAARAALERSETSLRLALQGSGSAMWDWDMQERQLSYCSGLARLLRCSVQQMAQTEDLLQRVHPDDVVRIRLGVLRCMASGRVRLLCGDGQYRWFAASGARHVDVHGRGQRFSGILTDLTAQRQAQERQRLAATVVDNTSEGVMVADADKRIVSVNAALTRLLGYSEQELLGRNPRVLQSGRHDQAFYTAMWGSVNSTGHWRGEIWNRRKNGDIFPERMSLSAVRDARGQVAHYVCMFSDITEEKGRLAQLEYLARHDPLTGIFNRHYFAEQLQTLLNQAQVQGEKLAVLQINMHRFKDINDSFGHVVGDEVYRHVVQQIQSVLRYGDVLGRVTGDELAVVMRELMAPGQAADLAQQLIAAVARPWRSEEGLSVVVSASVGICLYPDHARTAETLLQGAHAAGFETKTHGSGRVGFFRADLTAAAHERLDLEARLRQAMRAGDQLQVYYQPQVELASGRIVGAEALLRWRDPQTGRFISPAQFIPVAESSGLIAPLGEWVLRQVCAQGQRWQAQGLKLQRLAVNVSPQQFRLTDMYESVASALHDSGYPARALELEITESVLADDPIKTRDVLLRLRSLGLNIAVDDFGTGYSSLTYLKRFPLDVLKIDQGFIRDIPGDSDDMAISAAIIAMAHSLGLLVLAEGVETTEQLDFLHQRGCDAYQGYLCSRPVPADEFAALFQASGGLAVAS